MAEQTRWALNADRRALAAIDFTLTDHEGRPFAFDADRRGLKNYLLFFYRGYW